MKLTNYSPPSSAEEKNVWRELHLYFPDTSSWCGTLLSTKKRCHNNIITAIHIFIHISNLFLFYAQKNLNLLVKPMHSNIISKSNKF